MTSRITNIVCCLAMLLLYSSKAIAQLPDQQASGNRTWVFGDKAGMNFNPPTPAVITTNFRQSSWPNWFSTAASISNNAGQLVMYSVLDTIWDKNGNVLQNGAGLLPASVSPVLRLPLAEQNTLILPFINDTSKYYVFSLTSTAAVSFGPAPDPQNLGRLYYSVVDMTLNGGLGGVVPGQKGILLDSLLYERMVSVKGDQCNMWLVCMARNGAAFHTFEITPGGITTTPVISNVNNNFLPAGFNTPGLFESSILNYTGSMSVSPNNQKLAVAINGAAIQPNTQPFESFIGGFQLYDFNNSTGVVSNQINIINHKIYNTPGPTGPLIDLLTMLLDVLSLPTGGIAFSPDNTKIYTTHGVTTTNNALKQYDLSSGTQTGIIASEIKIDSSAKVSVWNGLRLGADDKIYMSAFTNPLPPALPETTLHLIQNPNLNGAATALSFNAVTLPTGAWASVSLGIPGCGRPLSDTTFNSQTVPLCAPETSLALSVPSDPTYSYTWDDGSTLNTRTVTSAGTYWVRYGQYCPPKLDTFKVVDVDIRFNLGNDTVICERVFPFDLKGPDSVGGSSYLWQDGSTKPSFQVTEAGTYSLTVSKLGCTASDTVKVDVFDLSQNLGRDISVCDKVPFSIRLEANVPDGSTVLWSTGATTPDISVSEPGVYGVTVRKSICSGTDTIRIGTELCDCISFMPTAFSPNGDGLNDLFIPLFEEGCLVTSYNFNIYNRWGQRVFNSIIPTKGWDGTFNGQPVDAGTYMFSISFDKGTHHNKFALKGDVILVK